MTKVFRALPLVLLGFVLGAPGAEAQAYGSLGLGAAKPFGDFKDVADLGLTFRGQAGVRLWIFDAHLQTGATTFTAADDVSESDDDNRTIYHAGAGARLGLGFLWVGANAAYFFGDGEKGIGFFPEVGAKIWRIEIVGDVRIDGDEKWAAARIGYRF